MNELIIDSEFRDLLPPLQEEQKEELEKDILKNGCISPLFTWKNILIDGYHRHEICTKHDIPFKLVDMEFKDRLEALEWIWIHQKNRRNLNKYELAQIALKFKPVIEAKAKENLKVSGENFGKGLPKSSNPNIEKSISANNTEEIIEHLERLEIQNEKGLSESSNLKEEENQINNTSCENAKEINPINTRKEIAKIAGVSEDTIHKVEVIEEKAPEEIKQQVKKGELTINSAYVLTKSAIEAEKKNAEYEKEYQKQLEKEKLEQEEKKKIEEIEKNLPENAIVLEKFRKPEETHIFGITDFNNLTNDQFDKCIKHARKYEDAIRKVSKLFVDNDCLRAWNCIVDTPELIDIELQTIGFAISNLIAIQNYFKGVRK